MDRIKGTVDIQVDLERGMQEAGRLRYFQQNASAIERGEEVATIYGQRLLSLHTTKLAEAIDAFIAEAESKRGRRHSSLQYLKQIDSRTAAWMALREILNQLTYGPVKLVVSAVKVGQSILTEIDMRMLRSKDKALFTGILKVTDQKSQLYRREMTAKWMASRAGYGSELQAEREASMLLGSKLIELAAEHLGVITLKLDREVKPANQKLSHKRQYCIYPTPEILAWIEKGHELFADLNPIYEPMVVPPTPWSDPMVGGYLTNEVRPLTMVKTPSKRYFRQLAQQEMPMVYSALNKIQATAWRINHQILDVLSQVTSGTSELGGMPSSELLALPEKPEDIDSNLEARKAYRVKAAATHRRNVALTGRRMKVMSILRTAKKFAQFETLYFPHQLDFRGRVYPVTQLSPQGEDFIKALLEFSNGEPLGNQQAADWLAIHIANLFGVDKVPFEERIQWTKDNSDMLLACAENPYDNRFWEEADKPFQALAAAFEWAGYLRDGFDHVSRIPVALDGSCSGLQNYGMALRCETTGKAVNLLPSEKPADIYQDVIDKVYIRLVEIAGADWADLSLEAIQFRARERLREIYHPLTQTGQAFEAWQPQLTETQYDEDGKVIKRNDVDQAAYDTYWDIVTAWAWLKHGYNQATGKMSRALSKRQVMTFPYGSREFGFRDQLLDDIIKPALEDENCVFHGFAWKAPALMSRLLWEAVTSTVLKAAEAMEWLQRIARIVASSGRRVCWTTPLGFLVEQNYFKHQEKRVCTTLAGNERVRMSLNFPTSKPDSMKQANSLSPNFIHAADASHLMLTVARSPDIDSWALIHDSFGTLPSRTQSLFMYVRVAMVELYSEHDLLLNFYREVCSVLGKVDDPDNQDEVKAADTLVRSVPLPPSKGNLDLTSVLRSRYCFA